MKYITVLVSYLAMSLLVFLINFGIYNYSFNAQATPFLHEEQRVDSALMMMKTTLPAYFVASLFITLIFFFLARKINKKG